MADYLTLEELQLRTGEKLERLRDWQTRGLIGADQIDVFLDRDLGRARLIHDLLHWGIDLDTIAQAANDPNSVFSRFLDEISERHKAPTHSLQEACEITGVDIPLAQRLLDAAGFESHSELLDEGDIELLRSCRIAIDAGLPEEAMIQILRVYADAMNRVAEVSVRSSHFYLHQPLREQGLPADAIVQRITEASARVEPLVEPALVYFHHKGLARAEWEDMIMHLEEEAGLAEKSDAPGQIRRAIMFVDLASFTPLAEAMGDLRALAILDRFGAITRKAVQRCHGRIVKQIGDAFMIVYSECYSAVSAGLELEAASQAEPQFPAIRIGMHWGPVLYREGDYIGSNVNIASRLAEEAHRHQFLVTDEVRRRAKSLEGAEFVRIGRRRLKGLAAELDLFEVRSVDPTELTRVADPVCGMELGPREIAARLTVDGREHAFCSDDCLRKFVKAPDLYSAVPAE
ncbi:MAG: adenylate/guanylate cyclase domain-containing protein [Chloroflexota bacterium]